MSDGVFVTLCRFSHGCLLRVSRNAPTLRFAAGAPADKTSLRRRRCYILLVTALQAVQLSSSYTTFHPFVPCLSHEVCGGALSDMLHSLSGFPFQISRGMIGCVQLLRASFSRWIADCVDTFTYCFLTADFQRTALGFIVLRARAYGRTCRAYRSDNSCWCR